jgi:hypothetical protein
MLAEILRGFGPLTGPAMSNNFTGVVDQKGKPGLTWSDIGDRIGHPRQCRTRRECAQDLAAAVSDRHAHRKRGFVVGLADDDLMSYRMPRQNPIMFLLCNRFMKQRGRSKTVVFGFTDAKIRSTKD